MGPGFMENFADIFAGNNREMAERHVLVDTGSHMRGCHLKVFNSEYQHTKQRSARINLYIDTGSGISWKP